MPFYRGTRYPLLTAGSLGAAFSPFSVAIFEAMTPEPDNARKAIIDTFVKALVAAGVWTKLDALYIFAAHAEAAALVNWANPGTFDATAVNSPTFAADEGFTGNGSSSYLTTSFNPSSAPSPHRLQDDACRFGRVLVVNTANRHQWGLLNDFTDLLELTANDIANFRVNCGSSMSAAGVTTAAFHLGRRTASNAQEAFVNGVSVDTDSNASTAVNDTLTILNSGGAVFSNSQIASHGFGAALDNAQQAALYAAELAYMQAVGAV